MDESTSFTQIVTTLTKGKLLTQYPFTLFQRSLFFLAYGYVRCKPKLGVRFVNFVSDFLNARIKP